MQDATKPSGTIDNKSFEISKIWGTFVAESFFGLFWGEQQPFVSSGYGGLYFFWRYF
jgi:hypothetical protein